MTHFCLTYETLDHAPEEYAASGRVSLASRPYDPKRRDLVTAERPVRAHGATADGAGVTSGDAAQYVPS